MLWCYHHHDWSPTYSIIVWSREEWGWCPLHHPLCPSHSGLLSYLYWLCVCVYVIRCFSSIFIPIMSSARTFIFLCQIIDYYIYLFNKLILDNTYNHTCILYELFITNLIYIFLFRYIIQIFTIFLLQIIRNQTLYSIFCIKCRLQFFNST